MIINSRSLSIRNTCDGGEGRGCGGSAERAADGTAEVVEERTRVDLSMGRRSVKVSPAFRPREVSTMLSPSMRSCTWNERVDLDSRREYVSGSGSRSGNENRTETGSGTDTWKEEEPV